MVITLIVCLLVRWWYNHFIVVTLFSIRFNKNDVFACFVTVLNILLSLLCSFQTFQCPHIQIRFAVSLDASIINGKENYLLHVVFLTSIHIYYGFGTHYKIIRKRDFNKSVESTTNQETLSPKLFEYK